jgi:hypothetical protein
MAKRNEPLLAWQYGLYPGGHRNRTNLLLHILTVPLFWAGTVSAAMGWVWPWLFAIGPAVMVFVMALQGRGHKLEAEPPAPFLGPLDVVARIFAEQWITFPRFVASGGFARAWRASG